MKNHYYHSYIKYVLMTLFTFISTYQKNWCFDVRRNIYFWHDFVQWIECVDSVRDTVWLYTLTCRQKQLGGLLQEEEFYFFFFFCLYSVIFFRKYAKVSVFSGLNLAENTWPDDNQKYNTTRVEYYTHIIYCWLRLEKCFQIHSPSKSIVSTD